MAQRSYSASLHIVLKWLWVTSHTMTRITFLISGNWHTSSTRYLPLARTWIIVTLIHLEDSSAHVLTRTCPDPRDRDGIPDGGAGVR